MNNNHVLFYVFDLISFVFFSQSIFYSDINSFVDFILFEIIFQDKVLLAISGGVVILSFAAMGLYRLAYLRYGALICAAAVLFAFRKKLLPILKQMSRGGKNHEE